MVGYLERLILQKALLGVAAILLLVGALALVTPIILAFAAVPFDKP